MDSLSEAPVRAHVNYAAIIVAALAAVAIGAPEWINLRSLAPSEVLAEFGRSLVVAYVLARFVVRAGVTNGRRALLLGGWVWFGFDAAILLGSVVHEGMPLPMYAVHAGYGLASYLGMAAILGAWHGRTLETDAENATAPSTPKVSAKAIVAAALAAIAVGGLWYSPFLFGPAWSKLVVVHDSFVASRQAPAVEGLGELFRSLVVAFVLARFIVRLRIADWKGAVLLGGAVWLGFHATLLLYSVIHENMSLGLYAIHAGHGLANDLVIAAILGAWRVRRDRA